MGTTPEKACSWPEKGRPWEELRQEMLARGTGDAKWRDGKTAVYVFHAGEDVLRIQKEAYTLYMSENGLGPYAFPSLKQMEEEVLSMAFSVLHGPENATGAMTSGGTDSITMAIKTARDYARAQNRLAGQGNIVLGRSAHPAFEKAAHLMDLEIRRTALDPVHYTVDIDAMEAAIDARTIMIVGSAPNFPHGIIDPIEALGHLAGKKDTWLHVDACVGGYFAPFARMNGVDVPPFDFEVPGVMSMSADLHKYGYAAKGASTVLFRSRELYQHMPFDTDDWSGGRMVTPTLAGTRPGGAIAAAWAVMRYLGQQGYREKQGAVCAARTRIQKGIEQMGFEVLGDPKLGLMAFRHPEANANALWGKMLERGWFTSITVEPPSLHLMLSPFHVTVAETYLADLQTSLEEIRAGKQSASIPEARYS